MIHFPVSVVAPIAAGALLTACIKCTPLECPVFVDEPVLRLEAPDGGTINGALVDSADAGDAVATCDTEGYCIWNDPIEEAGPLYLELSAPGYSTAAVTLSATVPDVPQPNGCPGCPVAMLSPSTVILHLAPDGGS